MSPRQYNFGEKEVEYNSKTGEELPVWQSPKYQYAKKKVIEWLDSDKYKGILTESDFWILMNVTKTGKMAYTGLIISHNGCLKINDTLEDKLKFNPDCITVETETYKKELLFTYKNKEQGLYEVGEVSETNCKNEYPYAMALKRCFDRVVLKNSRLAYAGVYSDSEAEEFSKQEDEPKSQKKKSITPYDFEKEKLTTEQMIDIGNWSIEVREHIMEKYRKDPIDLTPQEYEKIRRSLEKHGLIKTKEEQERIKKEKEEVF